MLTILNLLMMVKISMAKCRPTGEPWVPVNPIGSGLGKILNPSRVWIFLWVYIFFYRFRFGTLKPSRFGSVVISRLSGC
jgi:hypothetical protein